MTTPACTRPACVHILKVWGSILGFGRGFLNIFYKLTQVFTQKLHVQHEFKTRGVHNKCS